MEIEVVITYHKTINFLLLSDSLHHLNAVMYHVITKLVTKFNFNQIVAKSVTFKSTTDQYKHKIFKPRKI